MTGRMIGSHVMAIYHPSSATRDARYQRQDAISETATSCSRHYAHAPPSSTIASPDKVSADVGSWWLPARISRFPLKSNLPGADESVRRCGMLILVLGIVGYAILCFLALMWLIGVRVQLSIIGLGCQPCSDS